MGDDEERRDKWGEGKCRRGWKAGEKGMQETLLRSYLCASLRQPYLGLMGNDKTGHASCHPSSSSFHLLCFSPLR